MLWRLVFCLLVGLNLFLGVQFIWGESGLLEYFHLRDLQQELSARLDRIERENVRLSREIRLLKNDPVYQEKTVRTQMRFVRPGEILYLFSENGTNTGEASHAGKD